MNNLADKIVNINKDVILNESKAFKWQNTLDKQSDIIHVFLEHVQSKSLNEKVDDKGIEIKKFVPIKTHVRP